MKKSWKKIAAALLAAAMLLTSGCGKKENTEEAARVTLNEVAHSIFMRRNTQPLNWDISKRKA